MPLVVVALLLPAACADSDRAEARSNDAAAGEELAGSLGCVSCHSVDGTSRTGPTWQGLWGADVALANGETVTADDEYIERSVLDPSAEIVDGFSDLMPTIALQPDDLDALAAYIRSLDAP